MKTSKQKSAQIKRLKKAKSLLAQATRILSSLDSNALHAEVFHATGEIDSDIRAIQNGQWGDE